MPHDPLFEERVANALKAQGAEPEHKKMFGGVAFMVRGHMTVGITNKGDFMVRFDSTRHAEISQWPGAKPMTFGKGEMKGFLFVDADAVAAKSSLDKWVKLSLAHNATLPVKVASAVLAKATKTSGKKKPAGQPKVRGKK
ncbi:MAG: TfoX/Sxy family protein [Flavobacteriales bacterium]|nr:MAG: TfoX/Sxy family protein [Flavobacteriales bacterium]